MHNSFCSRPTGAVVCAFWLTGFFLGFLAADHAALSVVSLMRSGAFDRVSIVWLFLRWTFPFLITALPVMIQKNQILLPAVFFRCFLFSFLWWLEIRSFGSAAWLMVPLSRFSDWVMLLVFCRLLFCPESRTRGLLFWLLLSGLTVIVDCFLVSSWLAGL